MCCARFSDICARQMFVRCYDCSGSDRRREGHLLRALQPGAWHCHDIWVPLCTGPHITSHLPHLTGSHCPGPWCTDSGHWYSELGTAMMWGKGRRGLGCSMGLMRLLIYVGHMSRTLSQCHKPCVVTFTLANTGSLAEKRFKFGD